MRRARTWRAGTWRRWGAAVAALGAVLGAACAGGGSGDAGTALVRRAGATGPVGAAGDALAGLTVPSTPATSVPPTTTTQPPSPSTPAPAPGTAAYRGLGTWVDVYDWSVTFSKADPPPVGPQDVDAMAAAGVQTLYIQTAKSDVPVEVLEPERLLPIVERARGHGIAVVGWYLPSLEDPGADLARLLAIEHLGLDGIAVDIESRKVADVGERNRRLVELSAALRAALPGRTIGAIPFPPVLLDVVNPNLWPSFPWRELAPHYDVWLPMSYQSFRTADSGYRDAYRYTAENIDRIRVHLGWLDAPVHTIGGIADRTGDGDVAGMLRAAAERGALGGSLYDWRTTQPALWPALAGFRVPSP